MEKIPTIFDRDWEGNRAVVNKPLIDLDILKECLPTEKLDGTNVRLTVRNNTLVRLEKRRNPSKRQKAEGIKEPWYVDADEFNPEDKYIWEAARNRNFDNTPDGEWSGEALGIKIQGNPLNLSEHLVVLFSLNQAPVLEDAPTDFEGLKEWLPKQDSHFGKGKIEGIVWHHLDGRMFKIKTEDFKL